MGGTILVFNTLGIGYLFHSTANQLTIKDSIIRIFTFFPFVIFVVSVIINITGIHYGRSVEALLEKLATPFSVIALLAIGMQIELHKLGQIKKELILGLFFKLCVAPLIIGVLLWHVFSVHDLVAKVCILGAAIGPMNAMSVLAAEKGVNPALSIAMPAVGIPLSIGTLFLIDWLFI